ncbi:MAG TPA: hypothetical protein VGL58_12135 [Caulobacteraceae bacterium]|jgi:hypothetical protein
MSGRNQHHIPQFFQRGFGILRAGKPRDIWVFEKGVSPRTELIKRTAARVDFYSAPSDDGSLTLDDEITDVETPLSRKVAQLRALSIGARVDSSLAAEVVSHLAPRSGHVRAFLELGVDQIMAGAFQVFTDTDAVERLLGLDGGEPSERFQQLTADFKALPIWQLVQLPEPVVDRVIFTFAKETFRQTFEQNQQTIGAAIELFRARAGGLVRDSHNKAVGEMLGSSLRQRGLETLEWSIEAPPPEGIILPDCIAYGVPEVGPACAYMTASQEDLHALVMPLSQHAILLGRRPGSEKPSLEEVNKEAAACSHAFFLAADGNPAFAALSDLIGGRTTASLNEAVEAALSEYRPALSTGHPEEPSPSTSVSERGDEPGWPTADGFRYEVSFRDFGDQEYCESVAATLNYIFGEMAKQMPLGRLDGVTFANDYAAALSELDRGVEGAQPAETVPEDVGLGLAMAPLIVRDDVVKARIVMRGGLADALVSDDADQSMGALHVLVHQLAFVAYVDLLDTALPGHLLRPIDDPMDGCLFRAVNSALDAYVASCISAAFGDQEALLTQWRDLLIAFLDQAQQTIPPARLAYRYDADLDKLLDVALGAIHLVLEAAARLLGHCAALHLSPFDGEGLLAAALDRSCLRLWLETFRRDLERFWNRRGAWETFDEFLLFNRHVERLLWQFGIFPWHPPEGSGWRVEVPTITDVGALLADLAAGVPPPNLAGTS